jgi:hypothetical protein
VLVKSKKFTSIGAIKIGNITSDINVEFLLLARYQLIYPAAIPPKLEKNINAGSTDAIHILPSNRVTTVANRAKKIGCHDIVYHSSYGKIGTNLAFKVYTYKSDYKR